MPTATGLPSVNPSRGSWQLAHATVPFADRRPSKNSFSPSAIFSGVCGLFFGITGRVRAIGKPTWWSDFGRASESSGGIGPSDCELTEYAPVVGVSDFASD